MHKELDTKNLQQLSQGDKNRLNSHELLSRLSSFTARRSELVDCYKSFCVCVDDNVDDTTCDDQTITVNSNANKCTKPNDAEITNSSVDKIFFTICNHIDELHTL